MGLDFGFGFWFWGQQRRWRAAILKKIAPHFIPIRMEYRVGEVRVTSVSLHIFFGRFALLDGTSSKPLKEKIGERGGGGDVVLFWGVSFDETKISVDK